MSQAMGKGYPGHPEESQVLWWEAHKGGTWQLCTGGKGRIGDALSWILKGE